MTREEDLHDALKDLVAAMAAASLRRIEVMLAQDILQFDPNVLIDEKGSETAAKVVSAIIKANDVLREAQRRRLTSREAVNGSVTSTLQASLTGTCPDVAAHTFAIAISPRNVSAPHYPEDKPLTTAHVLWPTSFR